MTEATREATEFLAGALVWIQAGSARQSGSGFWVAPGLVLTSAHVVGAADPVTIRWQGRDLIGRPMAVLPPRPDPATDLWPFPDLALVHVEGAGEHPCAWLSDRPIGLNTRLHVLGHSQVYDGGTVRMTSGGGLAAGAQEIPGGTVWRFTGDEVAAGMSGGPVLDLATGAVCAVMKTTRQRNTNLGGLVVPLRGLRELPEDTWRRMWRAHDSFHTGGGWAALRARLRTERAVPHLAALAPDEETELLGVLASITAAVDLAALHGAAAGGRHRVPAESPRDLRDVVYGLAEIMHPPGELHPLLRLAVGLGRLDLSAAQQERLAEWAVRVATRRGEYQALRAVREQTDEVPAPAGQPSIMVRIEPSGRDPHRYGMTIWVHSTSGQIVKDYCDEESVHTVPDLRRILSVELRRLLGALQGHAMVEFVTMSELFDEDFEQLVVGRAYTRLGRANPVVLRDLERLDEPQSWHAWRARWQRFRRGEASSEWLSCRRRETPDQLDGRLRSRPEIGMVQLAMDSEGRAHEALGVALNAGVPVAVWSRRACPAGDACGFEPCPAERFRAAFDRRRDGSDIPLPELVRLMRSEAAAEPDHPLSGVVLLWDDPTRMLEPDAPLTDLAIAGRPYE